MITVRKLKEMFLEYNEKYFESSMMLPKIKTYIGDTSMGLFFVTIRGYRIEKTLSIARNFKLTKEELRDLLLHEMIHQYVYEKYGKLNHGRHFTRKMKELNKKYGFDIRKNSEHLFRKYTGKKSFLEKLLSLFKHKKKRN